MEIVERLARWQGIARQAVRASGRNGADEWQPTAWKTDYDLFAFFDLFRPSGAGLEKVFADVARGDEILKRVRRIYELKETETAFGYFVVRSPVPATAEELLELTKQHLHKVRLIAVAHGDEELAADLEPLPEIRVKRERIAPEVHRDTSVPEATVYCVLCDWFIALKPTESDALLLHEAFYSIAADYHVAHYLMWPLYRDSTDIEEPFEPYFELWRRGALPFFEKPGLVNVYWPPPE